MMTEDEAKTKWCPMSRNAVAVGPAGDIEVADNRLPGTGEARGMPVCIGSACMMWRWGEPDREKFWVSLDGKPEELWSWDPTTNGTYGQRVKVRKSTEGRKGYCGLAGNPE